MTKDTEERSVKHNQLYIFLTQEIMNPGKFNRYQRVTHVGDNIVY